MWFIIVGLALISSCTGESSNVFDDQRTKRENHFDGISYRPYEEAPERIKQILQLQQATQPLVHLMSHNNNNNAVPLHQSLIPHAAMARLHQLQETQPQVFPPQDPSVPQQQPNPALIQHQKNQEFVYQQQRLQNQLAQISRPLKEHYKNLYSKLKSQKIPQTLTTAQVQAPPSAQYKGLQALQAGLHKGPLPLRGQSLTPQLTYTSKQLGLTDDYKPVYAGLTSDSSYPGSVIKSGGFSPSLPIQVRKIIEGYNRG